MPPLLCAGPLLCAPPSQPPCTSNPQQQQGGQPITLQTLHRPSSPRALCTNPLPSTHCAACLFRCCHALLAISFNKTTTSNLPTHLREGGGRRRSSLE